MRTLDSRITSATLAESGHVISLGGEFDLHEAPRLESALARAIEGGARRVVVDLAGVDFIDSTILGVLNGGRDRLAARGGDLVLVTDDRRILRLFEVTGLDRRFRIEPTLTNAVAAVLDRAV